MKEIINSLNQESESDNSAFYSEGTLDTNDCRINIPEIGEPNLPLRKEDIQKLIALSSEAKFGLREKTLLNKEVRDTQEIKADKFTVKFNEDKLSKITDTIREDLALSKNSKLKAVLHNMLIYGSGQFFKKHQDTEKLDGMIATLVIILPSPHIGGDLAINHHGNKHRFISENIDQQQIKYIAFYSDCEHEVRKIKQGHRVALTFNIVLEANNVEVENQINVNLEKALQDHFSKPTFNENKDHKILTYLLDHEYTQHSLRWNMLKGIDVKNASSFLSAVKRLGLVVNLALIELRQTWTTESSYDGGYGGYSSSKEDDPEPEDLIDWEQHLYFWVDIKNNKLSYKKLDISLDEICFPQELSDLEPSDSEHEGYMGNYGDTVDYWYKRAAIVIWNQEDHLQMSFNLDYQAQINKLIELTYNLGNEQNVKEIISKAGKYIHSDSNCDNEHLKSEQYKKLLDIACYINDKDVATSLITHLQLTDIEKIHLDSIVQIKAQYGIEYCTELLTKWQNNIKESYRDDNLFKNIYSITKGLFNKKADSKLVEFFIRYQLDAIKLSYKDLANQKPRYIQKSLSKRINYIHDLFKSCVEFLPENKLTKEIVSYLMDNPIIYPSTQLVDIILSICITNKEHKSSYDLLLNYLNKKIGEELEKGIRADNDWSINQELRCGCEYCTEAMKFLRSNDKQKIWSIAMNLRKHIMEQFDGMCLPIKTEVLKKGSPHKLIITKSDKIHQNAKNHFKEVQNYHNKLRQNNSDSIG